MTVFLTLIATLPIYNPYTTRPRKIIIDFARFFYYNVITTYDKEKLMAATPNDLFQFAVENYNKANDLVFEMGKLAQKINPKFSLKTATIEFDLILQAALFKQALSDKKIDNLEVQFIEKITDTADLMDYMKQKFPDYAGLFSWESIGCLTIDDLNKLSGIIDAEIKELGEDFSLFYGMVDAATPDFNYFDALLDCTGAIAAALANIDGDGTEEEMKVASEATFDTFAGVFLVVKEQAEKELKAKKKKWWKKD